MIPSTVDVTQTNLDVPLALALIAVAVVVTIGTLIVWHVRDPRRRYRAEARRRRRRHARTVRRLNREARGTGITYRMADPDRSDRLRAERARWTSPTDPEEF